MGLPPLPHFCSSVGYHAGMALSWNRGQVDSDVAAAIVASPDGQTRNDDIRTLQLSEPDGYAVVSWDKKTGVWETWLQTDGNWAALADNDSATDAKDYAAMHAAAIEEGDQSVIDETPTGEEEPPHDPPAETEGEGRTDDPAEDLPDDPSRIEEGSRDGEIPPPAIDREQQPYVAPGDPDKRDPSEVVGQSATDAPEPEHHIPGVDLRVGDLTADGEKISKVIVTWKGELHGQPPLVVKVPKSLVQFTIDRYENAGHRAFEKG